MKNKKEERNKLIEENMRLVYKAVRKIDSRALNGTVIDKEDIIQIGMIGLLHAADKYDASRGTAFSTYAMVCIKNEINNELKKLYKANNNIAEQYTISLDQECEGDDKTSTLLEMIPDETDDPFYESKQSFLDTCNYIETLGKEFKKNDVEVIKMRMNGFSYKEIRKRFDLTENQMTGVTKRIKTVLGRHPEELAWLRQR